MASLRPEETATEISRDNQENSRARRLDLRDVAPRLALLPLGTAGYVSSHGLVRGWDQILNEQIRNRVESAYVSICVILYTLPHVIRHGQVSDIKL